MRITKENINRVFESKQVSAETMRLKGYRLLEELFVDSSGFGAENEPALTVNQFIKKLELILNNHPTVYATITNAGQFQVYIGIFSKSGIKKAKTVKNNTLEYKEGLKRVIRLHNTDIVVFNEDGTITLDSGGWQTLTTKTRMNQFLPSNISVYQKNHNWYVKKDDAIYSFKDGMTL